MRPPRFELELAVIPEHGTEQQLCNSAAYIFIYAAQHCAKGKKIAVAFILILPQQHGSHGQRQPPHHAERPPHQTGTAHPHPGGQAAEHGLHHVAQKRPDDKQPQQVCRAEEVDFPLLHCRGLPPGGLRVDAPDALFHIHGNAAAQGIGSRLQFLVRLFQHRVLRRVPPHQNRRAQLVQRRDAVCFSRRRFWNPESSELPSGIQTHPPREGRYSTKSFSLQPTFLGKTIRFLNRCGSSKSANKTKDRAVNGTQLTQAGHSSIQIPSPEGYPSGIRQEEPLPEPGILCG